MKLVLAIVQNEDAEPCSAALSDLGFSVTRLSSSGAFLQQGNATLFLGVEPEQVDRVIEVIRENCRERRQFLSPTTALTEPEGFVAYPVEVEVGGATIFVLEVDRLERA